MDTNVLITKTKNIKNNYSKNLEWCSSQHNNHYSYTREMGAIRNFKECILIDSTTQELLGEFKSITSACRYASNFLGCSYTGMEKYRCGIGCNGKRYEIIKLDEGVTTKIFNGIGNIG